MKLGEALKRFRKERGLTQKELANAIGIHIRQYQGYESGENIPSSSIIINLANRFKVSADYLLGLDVLCDRSEVYLLNDFRELNPEGQRSLIDYAEFLRIKHRDSNKVTPLAVMGSNFIMSR